MKTAIITGAAEGLGFEFAKLLASDGYNLIMVDINEAQLNKATDSILKLFPIKIKTIDLDLSTIVSADRLYDLTKRYDPEVVINNAGFGLGGNFTNTDWDLEQKMINLHVYSPIRFCKLILNDMIKVGRGKIINVSSIAAYTPGPFMAIYYATKCFMLSFGQAISYELEGTGVSLTTVCPGLVRTSFASKRASMSGVAPPNFGFMADGAKKVAKIAYNDMLKGNAVSIPVIKNRIMKFIMWLLPNSVVIRFIKKSQVKLNGI